MTDIYKAAQQALEALEDHAKQYPHMQKGYTVDAITALRTALAEQPAEQEPVQDECNRVINHAIEQGIEASVFLRCWREGDWSGCAEFGFEPNMAAYTAPQPAKRQPLTDEEICAALDIDGADDWTFKVAYAAIAAYERKNGGQP